MLNDEQGIIGCIILNNESLYKVYEKLKPKMFADQFCRECYEIMLAMYDRAEPIDENTISNALQSAKWDFQDVSANLIECATKAPLSDAISGYATNVINDYKARELKTLVEHTSMLSNGIDNSIAEIIAKCIELQGNDESTIKSLKKIKNEYVDNYFCKKDEKVIKTGLNKLDECLGGLQKGDVYIIGARPAVGKSAISLQMIVNMCEQGYRVGYYNLEMHEKQIYERVLSMFSKIGLQRIKLAVQFLGDEKEKFDSANAKIDNLQMIVGSANKISEIKAQCKHQKYDVIVIDYLQLLSPDERNSNRAVEVGNISKAAKRMAKELDVPVILLSQLKRKNQYNETDEPSMEDLRESGDIEQDASVVMLMWNMDEERTIKGLKVDKNRQGTLTKIALKFDGDNMNFKEYEDFKVAQKNAQKCDVQADDDVPFD